MKFLSNISILSKFLLLPALAAVCMLALTIVYVSARHSEDALISQIIYQDVPKMRELSRQFSEFSTNHVKFISLLTASLKGKAGEGQLYVHGRNSIIAVNKAISALGNLDASFELNAQQRQIAESLRHKLIRYRDRMSEAVLLASVQAHLVAQVTLDTNQTYDAANKEFLLFIDTVEQDANGSIAGMRATLHTNQINFIIIIAATLIFMVLFSVMLAILFTSDIKFTITLLTRLAHGDMAIVKQVSGR